MTVKELIQVCRRLNIGGYSKKRKHDIIILLEKNERQPETNIPSVCDVFELFYNKCERRDNDRINKLREDAIFRMFNTNTNEFFDLKKQFTSIFTENIPNHIVYDKFVLERKAGRGNNYDFAVSVQKNLFIQYTIKVEFKYGNSIFDYPQFVSIYITNRNFSLVKNNIENYVQFWYKNFLPEYLGYGSIQDEIPIFREYTRTINSTSYSTHIQKKLYEIMKNDPRTQRILYKIVDRSIEQYLLGLKLEDIDFEMIENMIRKQMDKLFIFCKNGRLSWYSFDRFTIDKTRFQIKNKNTLIVFDTENKFVLKFLLRWKNYKGLCGPAWQVGIRKMI